MEAAAKLVAIAAEGLDAAGRAGADIALLPESFSGLVPERANAGTRMVAHISRIAAKHGMYVVCPIKEVEIEQGEAAVYNTALVLDRRGQIVGKYRKRFAFWGFPEDPAGYGGGTSGAAARARGDASDAAACPPPPVFDTDFGRIGVLICFDINFTELWMHLAARGVRIVFWPSMYPAGSLVSSLARVFQITIVSAVPSEKAPPQVKSSPAGAHHPLPPCPSVSF